MCTGYGVFFTLVFAALSLHWQLPKPGIDLLDTIDGSKGKWSHIVGRRPEQAAHGRSLGIVARKTGTQATDTLSWVGRWGTGVVVLFVSSCQRPDPEKMVEMLL